MPPATEQLAPKGAFARSVFRSVMVPPPMRMPPPTLAELFAQGHVGHLGGAGEDKDAAASTKRRVAAHGHVVELGDAVVRKAARTYDGCVVVERAVGEHQ